MDDIEQAELWIAFVNFLNSLGQAYGGQVGLPVFSNAYASTVMDYFVHSCSFPRGSSPFLLPRTEGEVPFVSGEGRGEACLPAGRGPARKNERDRRRYFLQMLMKSPATHAQIIIQRLKKAYPDAKIVLNFSNHWELLVAVILSAQCTDKKVNEVTARLFKKYRTLDDYVSANSNEFEKMIRPTGFYRAKAKNILASAKIVKEKFGGKIPTTMEEMLTLKGVARKTANIVLGNAYGIVEGIAVDTHVRRLSQRLGLTKNENPEKIEQDLMRFVPKKDWFRLTYLLIDHGRAVCTAKDPRCDLCPLAKVCPSAFRFPRFLSI